jgi:DNA-binding transcriptional ArsR family regulator
MTQRSTNEPTGSGEPDRLAAVPARSPAEEALVDVVLAALADPTRRRILNGLSTAGGATATLLAQDLPVTRQAVVKHLAVLHEAGLVVGRKTGREVRYSVDPAPLAATARWMGELASEWDRPLEAVKRIAESVD